MNDPIVLNLLMLSPFLITALIFMLVMLTEPRSLWSGFSMLCMIGGLGITVLFYLFANSLWLHSNTIAYTILLILLLLVLIVLASFPFALAAIFLIEGIRLIRREGFSLSNCLSIGFSFLILAVMFLLPWLDEILNSPVMSFFYGVFSVIVGYLSAVLAIYAFSSILNLIHFRIRKLDQIVVLGSGIFETRVPPLLAARIQKGIDLQKKNPGSLLILSGGQGPGEAIPEGAAMKAWALEHGADPNNTVSEELSKNTQQNLLFSSRLFRKPEGKTALVTTRYHVFRALLYAKAQHIACIGCGSRTTWYFTLNAFLREFIAYLSLTKKKQIRNLAILLFPFVFLLIVDLVSWIFS